MPFGRVLGMQTRTGDVVLLEDILEEVKNRMLERMKAKESKKLLPIITFLFSLIWLNTYKNHQF